MYRMDLLPLSGFLRMERGPFVVSGPVPGFREGLVVDLETGRFAGYLTPEDLWLLSRYRHHLRPASSWASAGPHPSIPEVPRRLRVVE